MRYEHGWSATDFTLPYSTSARCCERWGYNVEHHLRPMAVLDSALSLNVLLRFTIIVGFIRFMHAVRVVFIPGMGVLPLFTTVVANRCLPCHGKATPSYIYHGCVAV